MSGALRFTIHYSEGGAGWVMAQVEEIPGAQSQGRTRQEARENVLDALRLALSVDRQIPRDEDHESLDLPLAL